MKRSEFLTGKVKKIPEKDQKNVKICTFYLKNWEFFSPGPTFGSSTPGPASALYASEYTLIYDDYACDVLKPVETIM